MQFAVVDIEALGHGLKADKSFIGCAGIKPLGKPGKVFGLHNEGFGPSRYMRDRRVVKRLREEMLQYDGWITWNGLLYDLPFINDRLMICGLPPLEKRFARGLDMMWHARTGKSTFTSSRLDWVAKALKCPYEKTPLDYVPVWQDAEEEAGQRFAYGRKNFMQVVDHCKWDLPVTEWVYDRLKHRVQTISKW